jgi:hypothetical protein
MESSGGFLAYPSTPPAWWFPKPSQPCAQSSGDVGCAIGEGWSGGTFSGLQAGCPHWQASAGGTLVLRGSEAAQRSPQ